MTTRKPPVKPRPKGGNTKAAQAQRRALFVEHWMVNGHNGIEAARAAGFTGSHGTLAAQATGLLKEPGVKAALEARSRQVSQAAEMTTENWAREVRALAFSRIGELYDAEGCLIPIHLLPDHVQAAIASVEVLTDSTTKGRTTKLKVWDKTNALGLMARHLGLFEKDNAQRPENVRVVVELVG